MWSHQYRSISHWTNSQNLEHMGRLFPKSSANAKPNNKDDDAAAFLRRFEQMTNPPDAARPLRISLGRMKRQSELDAIAQEPR